MVNVTVWNEYFGNQLSSESVTGIYPQGLHNAIADFLNNEKDITASTQILANPDQGLSEEVLRGTDVLIWWGHMAHDEVTDENARRVCEYVQKGMGIIFLHSAHKSKPFMRLLGGTGNLRWREAGEKEILWSVAPTHPIAAGLDSCFTLEHEEMYGEPFDIPKPDDNVFISWFQGGNVFRSGVTYNRGRGNVFYFQPGHESYPTYHDKNVQKVIVNAVRWAHNPDKLTELGCICEKDPLIKL